MKGGREGRERGKRDPNTHTPHSICNSNKRYTHQRTASMESSHVKRRAPALVGQSGVCLLLKEGRTRRHVLVRHCREQLCDHVTRHHEPYTLNPYTPSPTATRTINTQTTNSCATT